MNSHKDLSGQNRQRQDPIDFDMNSSQTSSTRRKQPNHTHIEIGGKNSFRSDIEKASFFSLIHFFFTINLIRIVNALKKKPLNIQNLNPLGDNERCQTLEPLFTKYYLLYTQLYGTRRRVLAFVIWKLFKKDAIIQLIWQLIHAASRILVAYFLYLMITSIRDPNSPVSYTYKVSLGFFLCTLVGFHSNHQINFNVAYAVNKMKVGLLGMMFRKVNRLSLRSVHEMSLGKLINIVANDLNNLDRIHFIVSLLISPFVLIGGWGFLYKIWGASSLTGISYMALTWIFQKIVAEKALEPRRQKSLAMDARLSFLNEALESIRLIKIKRWEFLCMDHIRKFRRRETANLKTANFLESITRTLVSTSHWIAGFFIFVTFTATGGVITSNIIFPTIYLLTHLRIICLINTFNCFSFIVEMKLLFRRIQSIMGLPEINPLPEVQKPKDPDNSIEFDNFTGFWVYKETQPPKNPSTNKINSMIELKDIDSNTFPPAISQINLQVKTGELIAIIGGAGSGKSSLLLSFTNEMAKCYGQLRYEGKFAYVSQQPILFFGPLKDSIIFGKSFDEVFFWKVLEAVHIAEDIRLLPEKEMTEIGERGAIFSRSQKTRIALARAIYTKADIYLLDDPLSVHDTKLAKLIFKDAIQGLLKDKTVLLVTHQLNLASYANEVIVMNQGKIQDKGTYKEIAQRRHNISEMFDSVHSSKNDLDKPMTNSKEECHRLIPDIYVPPGRMETIKEIVREEAPEIEGDKLPLIAPDEGLFIDNEKLDDGRVTIKIYWKYFKEIFASNWITFVPMICLFVGCESISWLFMVKMGEWGRREISNSKAYPIIAALAFGSLFTYITKYLLFFNSSLNASYRLHDKMLKGVFQSPMRFYHKNPLGRIMSRFSNDIGVLDKFLIAAVLEVLEGFCLFMVFLIALWCYNYWIFISAAVATFFYILIFFWCKKATNQTRGLELTTRSPLYSIFSIEVNGLTTIRALNQTEDATQTFYSRADDYSKASIAYLVSFRFMHFLIDYVTEITVIITFIVFIPLHNTPLAFGYFTNMLALLPTTLQWVLKGSINLNLLMASAARLINYSENYKAVELHKPNDKELSKEIWDKGGEIEVKNASMKYSDAMDSTIKNFSMHINPGEKVAIVGNSRTGMSSIVYMLQKMYRIEEIEGVESFIKIDGVNIKDVGIHLVRKAMTTMPEHPYIFTATIRENLDPWNKYTDQEIWEVLADVELKEFVEKLKEQLNTKLSKGSSVFSMGQKELLCVARALLEKNEILLQDEPIAHVDIPTHDQIQKNILKKFAKNTVITMTHHLSTIAEYDKVLILKNGDKIEFNEPYRLLVKEIGDTEITNKKSYFATLVLNRGARISKRIFREAMKRYYARRNLPLDIDLDHSYRSLSRSSSLEKLSHTEGSESFSSKDDEESHHVHNDYRRGSQESHIESIHSRKGTFLQTKTTSTDKLLGDKYKLEEISPNLLMKIRPRRFTHLSHLSTGTPRSSFSIKE